MWMLLIVAVAVVPAVWWGGRRYVASRGRVAVSVRDASYLAGFAAGRDSVGARPSGVSLDGLRPAARRGGGLADVVPVRRV